MPFSNTNLARLLLIAVCCVCTAPATADKPLTPPMAMRQPKDVSVHDDVRIDDYYWLRDRTKPETDAYLKAEADYTADWFKPLAEFKENLYQEMLSRVKQADEGVPVRNGKYFYFSRTLEGAQYPVYLRRPVIGPQRSYSEQAPEQLLLDMNAMVAGKKYLELASQVVSPDGRRLAYALDETGGHENTLYAKDIASGRALPVQIKNTEGFAWADDNQTLFYVTQDASKRASRLWRHQIGGKGRDTLLYEEENELFDLSVGSTQDHRYLVLTSAAKDTTEVRVLDAAKPLGRWRVVFKRKTGREYSLEHHTGRFYMLVNDTGRTFRLISTPVARPSIKSAQEIVAQRADTTLEQLVMFKRQMVLQERVRGAVKLRVFELPALTSHRLEMAEAAYAIGPSGNGEYDTDTLRFDYQSLSTPPSVFDYDLSKRTRSLRKVQPVLGGFDAARYESRRMFAMAADGTRVPMSMVYRKDRPRGVAAPTLLYGYGSYGIPTDPWFSATRISLLDRGVVFVVAHVRGGGDLGRAWYDDGKLGKKMNTFTDFIAAAETLVAQGITTPAQLIIRGGSAGGLLMAAVTNMRPDLFQAVVAEVPFVDVINTMLDETIPLTTGEFIEWGNPKIREQYQWLRAYSPYDNLKLGAYPSIYIHTGLNDSQVAYWEPAKYVARLRTLKTDQNPLLFDINLNAGHGGASGRFDALREEAQIQSFIWQQWRLMGPPKPCPSSCRGTARTYKGAPDGPLALSSIAAVTDDLAAWRTAAFSPALANLLYLPRMVTSWP